MQSNFPVSLAFIGSRGPDRLRTDDLVTSATGVAVAKASEDQRQMRNGSILFDPPARRQLKRALRELAAECAKANWDGEGATHVEWLTLDNAIRFVDALPMGLPEPEPGVHPDGELSFSWIGTKGHRLSVSIGPTGKITYAYRRVASKVNGTEWMGDRIPEAILDHITTFLPRA
jgi:hypothetical protein